MSYRAVYLPKERSYKKKKMTFFFGGGGHHSFHWHADQAHIPPGSGIPQTRSVSNFFCVKQHEFKFGLRLHSPRICERNQKNHHQKQGQSSSCLAKARHRQRAATPLSPFTTPIALNKLFASRTNADPWVRVTILLPQAQHIWNACDEQPLCTLFKWNWRWPPHPPLCHIKKS